MKYATAATILRQIYPDLHEYAMDDGLLLYLRDAVTVIPGDPLEVTVADPAYLDPGPIRLWPEAGRWICPCMDETGAPDPCVHVLAAQLALATLPDTPQAPDALDDTLSAPVPTPTSVVQHEPHSLSVKGVTAKGFEVFLCLRGYNERELFHKAADLLDLWERKGWQPPYGSRRPLTYQEVSTATPPSAPPAPVPSPASTPPVPAPPSASTARLDPGALVFHVDRLEATFMNKQWYWAAFGYDMPRSRMKFGIRIWEEGLQSGGFDIKTLDPANPPAMQGWLAQYILDEEGKPSKVVRLLRKE